MIKKREAEAKEKEEDSVKDRKRISKGVWADNWEETTWIRKSLQEMTEN